MTLTTVVRVEVFSTPVSSEPRIVCATVVCCGLSTSGRGVEVPTRRHGTLDSLNPLAVAHVGEAVVATVADDDAEAPMSAVVSTAASHPTALVEVSSTLALCSVAASLGDGPMRAAFASTLSVA